MWSVRFSNYNQIALVLNIVSFTVFTLTASVNSSWKSMGKVIYVLPARRRLLCSACNKGNRRRLHAGKYMFGKSSFLRQWSLFLTSTDDRIQQFSSMSVAFPGQSIDEFSLVYSCFEPLSEKELATMPKGIVGSFEFTFLQRNLKEWQERPWTYVCES